MSNVNADVASLHKTCLNEKKNFKIFQWEILTWEPISRKIEKVLWPIFAFTNYMILRDDFRLERTAYSINLWTSLHWGWMKPIVIYLWKVTVNKLRLWVKFISNWSLLTKLNTLAYLRFFFSQTNLLARTLRQNSRDFSKCSKWANFPNLSCK